MGPLNVRPPRTQVKPLWMRHKHNKLAKSGFAPIGIASQDDATDEGHHVSGGGHDDHGHDGEVRRRAGGTRRGNSWSMFLRDKPFTHVMV